MSLTDYEKYHLHEHVYDKKEVDTKIPTRIFYRGHCKHNNNRKVEFYINGTATTPFHGNKSRYMDDFPLFASSI